MLKMETRSFRQPRSRYRKLPLQPISCPRCNLRMLLQSPTRWHESLRPGEPWRPSGRHGRWPGRCRRQGGTRHGTDTRKQTWSGRLFLPRRALHACGCLSGAGFSGTTVGTNRFPRCGSKCSEPTRVTDTCKRARVMMRITHWHSLAMGARIRSGHAIIAMIRRKMPQA